MSELVRLSRSTVVDAPVGMIWHLLRDFNSHASWHPAISASHIQADEPPDSVGAVRVFRLADGSLLSEQLIALSDREHELTYCLLEAPLPLIDYVATMRLRPVTDGDRTFITWESRFRPPKDQAVRLARLVSDDIYDAGFAALKSRFERHVDAPRAPALAPAAERQAPPRSIIATPAGDTIEARAIVVPEYGGAEVLEARVVAVPPPRVGEVRLRHTAIGVNFIDIYCRTGIFRLLTPPDVLGMEAAGVVVDVGEGVSHLRPGDRVVYACEPVGAYSEARTMDAALLVPIPDDIDDETAAAAFLKGLSAEFLLHRVHQVSPDETVLVHAASGGVGSLLCQWASAIGARVIGTVSTEEKAEHARAAGCAHVVVHAAEDFLVAVERLTAGRGVDVVYDGVGQTTFARSLEALAPRGHLVSHGQASGPVGSWDIGALAAKSLTVSRPNFGHYTTDPVELRAMSGRLFDALRHGVIRPMHRTLPLAEAAEAHRHLESRANTGALVLIP